VGPGAEPHELDSNIVRNQIALFAETELVVATRGAGLTNSLFSNLCLRVIDIFVGKPRNGCSSRS
jgi:capsular polysaccharide biosynthesis protein